MQIKKTGFTLIETIISIPLITISTLFLMKSMIVSIHGIKNSNTRFLVGQILENKKNSILGMKSGSPFLCAGNRMERDGDIKIRIEITDVSEALKKITLEGSGRGYTSISVFYRSENIREGQNE